MNNVHGPGVCYWTSALLVVIAILLHGAGWAQVDKASHLKAAAVSRASQSHGPIIPDPAATQAARVAKIDYGLGYTFAAGSVLCLLAASWRKEGGYYLLVILFLMLDFTFSLIP